MRPGDLRWGADGLLPAVVQGAADGAVLMVAWMNAEALERTLAGPHAVFWSRSRRTLWTKGETSGNVLGVVSVRADCDADTLLVTVDPAGPACHTGATTCFFGRLSEAEAPPRIGAALVALEEVVAQRRGADPADSWTARLLTGGPDVYGAKIREEAEEVVRACAAEPSGRVAEEAADLLYHLMVGLGHRGVSISEVAAILALRAGVSGLEEKARRPPEGSG